MRIGRKLTLSFALALALSACQTTGAKVSFQNVEYQPGTKTREVFASLAKPNGKGPFPAVVLLHSCAGVHPHTNVWSDFLTARGYAVLTVDSFGSRELGRCPNSVHPINFARSEMVADAYGALDYLAAQPDIDANRVYVMGFSVGGFTINMLATRPSLSRDGRSFKGAISLYAPCPYEERLTFPTMVVIGSLDGIEAEVRSCKVAIERKTSPDLEAHILEGVYHAFDQDRGPIIRYDVGGRPMLYDRRALRKSEQLVEAFLATHQ